MMRKKRKRTRSGLNRDNELRTGTRRSTQGTGDIVPYHAQ